MVSMRRAVLAAVAIVAILVGAGAGFEYEYATLNGRISDLSQTVSSQAQQISSLSSEVPDNEIFGVVYVMTLWSHGGAGLSASAFSTVWDIGLRYHTGQQVTLYVDASQLFNYTGLMNITYVGTRTGGFSVSSISPGLPVVVDSGVTNLADRSVLTMVLNTPSNWHNGFLEVYIQAYSY